MRHLPEAETNRRFALPPPHSGRAARGRADALPPPPDHSPGELMLAPDPPPAGYRLELFGGPTVRDPGGVAVPLSPGHEVLLSLVWGHGERGLQRAKAIRLLWEEEDSPRGRHRLRQLLHEVVTRLGFRPVISEDTDTIHPDPDALPSDLDDYAAALGRSDLRQALAVVRKGFASGLRRLPGEAFEDWLEAKRVALRRDLRDAAAKKWDRHRQGDTDWPNARDAAEVLYALDPSESSLRKVAEARAATGQVGLAEAAFAEYERHLPPEDRPSPETVALMERIGRLGTTRISDSEGQDDRPPLVGRRTHLEKALNVLDQVKHETFEFLLIRGEAGVGKTRLFDEVMREAYLRGFRCLEARPAELERHIPLNPLVDMVSRPEITPYILSLEDPWRAVVASLLPTLPDGMDPPVVPYITETSLSRRLYDAFTYLLAGISGDQPTLLFIDDLQWADDTTIAVLQFAQKRWKKGAIGVVATVRDDLVTSSQGVSNYLSAGKDLPVSGIELQDLTDSDAIRLVDLVADGSLDRETCSQLCALGGRNPFYLIELTKDYLAGRIQLPELPGDALLIPISLRQLVDPRLEGLSPEASSTAAHLAVWGRAAPLFGLSHLLATTLDECTRWVEELERSRLVVVERGSVTIAHQLFRGAIYHGMTNARRALLHRTIAEYLTTTDQPLPGELAVHFAEAGDAAHAAVHSRSAADQALENGAVAEAAHFLQLLIENEGDDHLKAEATGDLARVLHMNREILRANPLLELAATRLRVTGNNSRALRLDIRRVEGLAEIGTTPMSELLDRLASIKAAARQARDDEALAFALDTELHLLHRSGKVAEVRQLMMEIRRCAESANATARCQAKASLALNVLFGDGNEGLECAREAVRIAEAEGLKDYALVAMNRLLVALLCRGLTKSAEARGLLEKASANAKHNGDVALRFFLVSNRGVAHFDAGELDEASAAFEEAGGIITRATEAALLRVNRHCNLGELAYQGRDSRGALTHFRQAEELLDGATRPTDVAQIVNAGIGLCYLDLGLITDARRRETLSEPLPDMWTFDPSLVLTFQARLLERRGEPAAALEVIRAQREGLRDRLPSAWLRMLLLEVRLAKKCGREDWRETLHAGIAVADRLGYSVRSAEFRACL